MERDVFLRTDSDRKHESKSSHICEADCKNPFTWSNSGEDKAEIVTDSFGGFFFVFKINIFKGEYKNPNIFYCHLYSVHNDMCIVDR